MKHTAKTKPTELPSRLTTMILDHASSRVGQVAHRGRIFDGVRPDSRQRLTVFTKAAGAKRATGKLLIDALSGGNLDLVQHLLPEDFEAAFQAAYAKDPDTDLSPDAFKGKASALVEQAQRAGLKVSGSLNFTKPPKDCKPVRVVARIFLLRMLSALKEDKWSVDLGVQTGGADRLDVWITISKNGLSFECGNVFPISDTPSECTSLVNRALAFVNCV